MTNAPMYAVIDHASHNILGELEEYTEAEAMLHELIDADARAVAFVEIIEAHDDHHDGGVAS
jgi:hypothetical protein